MIKTKTKKSVSDRYLEQLWRKAVLAEHGHRCFFCHYGETVGPLEAHHIVRRARKVLRWDWRNGIPVHKYHLVDGKMTCHQFAHTKAGERIIARRHQYYRELCRLEQMNFKEYMQQGGVTEDEFRRQKLAELKEKINEDL